MLWGLMLRLAVAKSLKRLHGRHTLLPSERMQSKMDVYPMDVVIGPVWSLILLATTDFDSYTSPIFPSVRQEPNVTHIKKSHQSLSMSPPHSCTNDALPSCQVRLKFVPGLQRSQMVPM